MKGFKKNGKFIPTEKRNKSSLKKTDIETPKTAKIITEKEKEKMQNDLAKKFSDYDNRLDARKNRNKETMNKDAEDILNELNPNSEEKMKSIETLEEEYEDEEDEREKLADKLGDEFNKIITVDDAYGSVYGINDEFYKVGVQYGLSAYELEEIRDDIGYEFESVEVGNEHFVNMIFKKIEDETKLPLDRQDDLNRVKHILNSDVKDGIKIQLLTGFLKTDDYEVNSL